MKRPFIRLDNLTFACLLPLSLLHVAFLARNR